MAKPPFTLSAILACLAVLGSPAWAGIRAPKTTVYARSEKLAIHAVTPERRDVPVFGKFELTLNLGATYDNPFDPEDIDVSALFTSSRGTNIHVNGFLYQPYARTLKNGSELLTPTGPPTWKLRFCPAEQGRWTYRVTARDRSGSVSSQVAEMTALSSTDPGFVRRSARNPFAFAYEGEKPFFAVGENMCWAGRRGTYDFDTWLPDLHKAGGNWIRIWMNNFNTTLEWTVPKNGSESPDAGFHGLGVYSLDHAWKLDTMLEAATENDIYTMLCFGTYGEFTTGGFFGEGQWPANPDNAVNGGPCAKPDDFWTDPTARKLYRQRVRYILARYGYSTHIQAWEFWNEANPPADWVGEMARFVKSAGEFHGPSPDPYRHLVTTTYGSDAIWNIPEIDFTQTHSYGTGNIVDHAPVVASDGAQHRKYAKPHIMGEFGIDWRAPDSKYDPRGLGVNLHNALWSSMMSGDAGTAMIWWWDNYIAPEQVYAPFVPVRKFADRVPWTAGIWKPIAIDAPRSTSGPETFSDLTISASLPWGKSPTSDFTITPHGLADNAMLPQFLYAPDKADLRTTPALHVHFERAGRFRLRIDTVSNSSQLRILLDGAAVVDRTFDAAPPKDPAMKPEYEQTEYKKEYGMYQARFNKEIAFDVPAGDHTITLENVAGDWMSLAEIRLSSYRSSRYPNLSIYGQIHGEEAILWAQNAAHNWKNVAEGIAIPPIAASTTILHGLPDGRYTVEWWDTATGEITARETAVSHTGDMKLHLPEIATDVAARVYPVL